MTVQKGKYLLGLLGICLLVSISGCSPKAYTGKYPKYNQDPAKWREPVDYNFIILTDGSMKKSFKPLGMKGKSFVITPENEGEKLILQSDVAAFQDRVGFYRLVKNKTHAIRRVKGAINFYRWEDSYMVKGLGAPGTLEGVSTRQVISLNFMERNNDGTLIEIGPASSLDLAKEWMKDSPAAMEVLSKIKVRKGYVKDYGAVVGAIEIYDNEHPEGMNLLN